MKRSVGKLKYRVDYAAADAKQSLLHMTLPLLVALILNMTYSMVDSLWIGNLLGEKAMAALTSSTAVILLLNCVIAGLTNGIGILLGQAVGSKDAKRIGEMKTTSFILSFVLMGIIVVLCEVCINTILRLLNTPKETFSMSCWYLRIYLLGVLSTYFYMYFATVLRCYGNTMLQMIVIVFCTILNAVLDPVFMHFFGFNGVAVATVVTQTISLLIMVIYIVKKQYFKIKIGDFRKKTVISIFAKGIPSIVQQSIPAVSTMALTTLVSEFGLTAIAAFGVIGKVENLLLYPVMALNMGLTTIASQCIGSRRVDRMSDYVKCSIKYSAACLLIMLAVIVLFSKNISWLFVQSDDVGSIVRDYFYIVGIGYVIHAVTTSFIAGLNGMGKTVSSMVLCIFYFLCVRVPLAYVLAGTLHLGLRGIWLSFIISHFVAVVTAAVLFRIEKRKINTSSDLNDYKQELQS